MTRTSRRTYVISVSYVPLTPFPLHQMIFIIHSGEWKKEEERKKIFTEWDWENVGTASDSTYSINYTVQWSLISGHSPWVDYKTRTWRAPWVDWCKGRKKTGHDPSRMWALRTSPYVAGPYVAVTHKQVCCATSHLPRYLLIPGWQVV